MTPQEQDQAFRFAQANERRERDALLRADRLAESASTINFDPFVRILEAADQAFSDGPGYSLSWGEYGDGTPAPPDIHELIIEGHSSSDLLLITAPEIGSMAWVYQDGRVLMVTTPEGYCRRDCTCPGCEYLRVLDAESKGVQA